MLKKLLIANRGEIAIRIARTAADLGISTVSIYSEDDNQSLHTRHTDTAVDLNKIGIAAYLDADRIVSIALEQGCDSIHPGYGFLSESAEFASICEKNGLIFVGPSPEGLHSFGDKAAARALADKCDVPVLPGRSHGISLEELSLIHI